MRRRAAGRRDLSGGEEAFVGWLRATAHAGIGDDAALLRLGGALAWTVDSQHEGVHLPRGCDPGVAARRLLAVNLSDLAAVGAQPLCGLLALAAPNDYDRRRFVGALVAAARRHGMRLVGGDTSRLDTLSATLTLIGRRPAGSRWLRRSAARPGDAIWVGGTLGESALGLALVHAGATWHRAQVTLPPGLDLPASLARAARRAVRRHLLPEPQLDLSRCLAGSRRRVAALDVSDGLGKDLARLCAASGVGAEVTGVPLAAGAPALAVRLGLDARELALAGGEDYVLLFTQPAGAPAPAGCTAIGRITASRGVWLLEAGNRRREVASAGFDHFAER